MRGCKALFAIVLVDWNPGDQFNPVFFYEVPPKTQLLILLKGRVPHLLFFDIKLHIIWKKDSKNYFNMNRYITTHIRHIHGSWLKLGVKFVCYLTSRQVLNLKIKLFSIILHTLIVPKLHLHGVVVTDGSSLQVEIHGKQRWSEMFARKHCHVKLNVFNIKSLTVSQFRRYALLKSKGFAEPGTTASFILFPNTTILLAGNRVTIMHSFDFACFLTCRWQFSIKKHFTFFVLRL